MSNVEWENLTDEIADVRVSELHAVRSFFNLMMVRLLKLQAWPDDEAINH